MLSQSIAGDFAAITVEVFVGEIAPCQVMPGDVGLLHEAASARNVFWPKSNCRQKVSLGLLHVLTGEGKDGPNPMV